MNPTDVLQDIRNYYGEAVALYFAWMEYYIQSLMLPGILGLALVIT